MMRARKELEGYDYDAPDSFPGSDATDGDSGIAGSGEGFVGSGGGAEGSGGEAGSGIAGAC